MVRFTQANNTFSREVYCYGRQTGSSYGLPAAVLEVWLYKWGVEQHGARGN